MDWEFLRILVPLNRHFLVVNLGSRVSPLARALVGTCRMVIAMGPDSGSVQARDPERVPAGASVVSPLCGDATGYLPFRDRCLDLIILDQVADGTCRRDEDRQVEIQAGLLSEARRVLKPEGGLCLVVARHRSRITPRRLRVLLEGCGFSSTEFYWPYPAYCRVTALASLTSGRAMASCIDILIEGNAFRERKKRAWLKALARLDLLQYTVPEYLVLATRGV